MLLPLSHSTNPIGIDLDSFPVEIGQKKNMSIPDLFACFIEKMHSF